MAKRIFIKWNWLMCAIVMLIIGIVVMNTILVKGEIISDGWRDRDKKGAYHPYPILFLHGFAGGSNYTWNPDPDAPNQAEEAKKPTAVLDKYFNKYFRVNLSLNNLTQFPYLETIEFFNSKSSPQDQLMDRNSSVDRFKIGDYYVEHGVWWHKKKEGDPGWADKVSYALRGEPIHDLSKYLYDTSPGIGGGPVLQNYLPPNATSFKALMICHSMGGLSAREYLTNKTFYPGVEKSVDRLITIDTPHLGSVLAVLADATVEVQRIATSVSIAYPQFGWLMAAPVVIEVVDNGLELIGKIDIDGDAVNDMDPLSLLGRFSSGFLGQLNARSHPQGVQYYIVYGSLPFAQIIDGFSIQGFINLFNA